MSVPPELRDKTQPEGIDVGPVTAWFQDNVPAVRPPLRFELIQGGRSNLTYRVSDADGRAFVLRRPPLGRVLASAHDVGREHRVISAVGDAGLPVPPALGFCSDESVNGAPFYVMGFVDGLVLRRDHDAETQLSPAARMTAGEGVVDTLVALHAVDPELVGLGDLGRRDGYIERQLRRWLAQWEQGHTRELPLVEEVHRRLAADVPKPRGAGIVHGDYRLDNLIVSSVGEVLAVLDWELCTLGDPLADLGLLIVYWGEPGDGFTALESPPTQVPGFPTRRQVVDRYADRSGRDLSDLDFYVAFGYWKLACICEGVYSRFLAGSYGENDEGFANFGRVVEPLAEAAAVATDRAGR
ncbi:MAG: phosphotransferase family protein [Acidimicrobiia bacterium]